MVLMSLFFWAFAYDLVRSDFIKLISLVIGLFGCAYLLIERFGTSVKALLVFGILVRLIFVVALPNLSQDYFRFIWDGRLILEGINPYANLPYLMMQLGEARIAQAQELYDGMGLLSANNFSNYPPFNQLIFAISALLGGNSTLGTVLVMRALIILADIGVVLLSIKILKQLKLPIKNAFWYFLNPFIIIELTGNLHFEGVMCFFILASIYLILKKQWIWSAILLGCAISVKLLPLLLLPLFFRTFVKKTAILNGLLKLTGFYVLVLATFALSFLPFLTPELLDNFTATIGLWFNKFEFNASIYYIIREIGYLTIGWNIIADVGHILALIVFFAIVILALFRNNDSLKALFTGILFTLGIYFLLATTVHPWYLATPLMLSIFTRYRFIFLWSGMVFLSYAAYSANGFNENLWLVGLEYLAVISYLIWEILRNRTPKASLS